MSQQAGFKCNRDSDALHATIFSDACIKPHWWGLNSLVDWKSWKQGRGFSGKAVCHVERNSMSTIFISYIFSYQSLRWCVQTKLCTNFVSTPYELNRFQAAYISLYFYLCQTLQWGRYLKPYFIESKGPITIVITVIIILITLLFMACLEMQEAKASTATLLVLLSSKGWASARDLTTCACPSSKNIFGIIRQGALKPPIDQFCILLSPYISNILTLKQPLPYHWLYDFWHLEIPFSDVLCMHKASIFVLVLDEYRIVSAIPLMILVTCLNQILSNLYGQMYASRLWWFFRLK